VNPAAPSSVGEICDAILLDGFAVVPDLLTPAEVDALQHAIAAVTDPIVASKHGTPHALRNLLEASPEVRALAETAPVRALVEPILGKDCFPVRGILFDKIPGANWKVPFHQDVTIAVREKVETKGFGPWSVKAGVLHTQPPVAVLESMLSVRIHLDDCHERNGALRVVPGSHRLGRVAESDIDSIRQQLGERVGSVSLGGVLLMRPLLLHASSQAQIPEHRRVIHIDFAAHALPGRLRWL
jgi:ectoine hydroxylase-related dioxygenase (phytanoyl-CoA dioxygenase family)